MMKGDITLGMSTRFGSEAKTDLKSSKRFDWPLWSMPIIPAPGR